MDIILHSRAAGISAGESFCQKNQAFSEKMCIFAVVMKKGNVMKEEETLIPYAKEELDKEFYTPEEAYELVMSDIKPIYGIRDDV